MIVWSTLNRLWRNNQPQYTRKGAYVTLRSTIHKILIVVANLKSITSRSSWVGPEGQVATGKDVLISFMRVKKKYKTRIDDRRNVKMVIVKWLKCVSASEYFCARTTTAHLQARHSAFN